PSASCVRPTPRASTRSSSWADRGLAHPGWTRRSLGIRWSAYRRIAVSFPAPPLEASPSPVYGAALLMRFGFTAHPGFKSPSLRFLEQRFHSRVEPLLFFVTRRRADAG